MPASYPGAIKTFTAKTGADVVASSHMNDVQLEVNAIETELGVDVAGSRTDLEDRLLQSLATDGDLDFAASTELTIATGAITITQNWHTVDTEADAASDDLDTINGGADGYVLILHPNNDARTIVLRHNIGNILCVGNANLTLDDAHDIVVLTYDGTLAKWCALQGSPASNKSRSLDASVWTASSDAASFNSAQMQVKQSSAAVPSSRWIEWLFDAATDEHIVCSFTMPQDYVSAPVLKVQFKMTSATSGSVVWVCQVMAVTPGDATDLDAEVFAAANSVTEAVPATAGYLDEASITLTNADSVAAGDRVTLLLFRDANNAADDAAGDAEFVGADLRYS